jgi:hypothetical protein
VDAFSVPLTFSATEYRKPQGMAFESPPSELDHTDLLLRNARCVIAAGTVFATKLGRRPG